MPWKETCPMDEREAFVQAWLSGEFTMTELCERFGVSRPTGYQCLRRFQAEGRPGLSDRSRAPHRQAKATPAAQVEAIVALKRRHLSWGPLTLRARPGRRIRFQSRARSYPLLDGCVA